MASTHALAVLAIIPLLSTPGFSETTNSIDLTQATTQHTFANGLRVLIVKRPDLPTISTHIRYRVGSVDDPPGLTGLAHFVEHLLFKGTDLFGTSDRAQERKLQTEIQALRAAYPQPPPAEIQLRIQELEAAIQHLVVPNDLWRTYRQHGAAQINAVTYRDSTQFFATFPKNQLELWALLESDRIRNPVFREFEIERAVVEEEYQQTIRTQPENLLQTASYAIAFSGVPYNHPPWGWPGDLRRITPAAAATFARQYYTARNALMVLVGDLDPPKVIALIDRYFGSLPDRPRPPAPSYEEAPHLGLRRTTVVFPAEPQLLFYFQTPPATDPHSALIPLLANLLTTGRTSRLHQHLVEERRIAQTVSTDLTWVQRYSSLLVLLASPRLGRSLVDLETAIWAELKELLATGITPAEQARVLAQAETHLAAQLTSPSDLATELASTWDFEGDWRAVFTRPDQLRRVTPEDLYHFARQHLRRDHATIGWLVRNSSKNPAVSAPSDSHPATP